MGANATCAATPEIYGDLKPLWSMTLGGGSLAGVAVDGSRNIVVGGATSNALQVGSTVIPAPDAGGINGPFVLKLDPTGALLWHRTFAGQGNVDALGVDAAGNVYIAGDFDVAGDSPASLNLGTGVLQGTLFIAKLDPSGTTLWAHAYQPYRTSLGGGSGPLTMAVDPAGDVAIIGMGVNPGAFGATVPSSNDEEFLAAFDPSGALRYSKVFAGAGAGAGVSFDPSGNLFVTGYFSGSLDLGAPLPANGGQSAFVAMLDATGNVRWQTADGAYSTGSAVAASSAGAFVVGGTSGTAGIANPVPSQGMSDDFLVQLDHAGHPVFETTIPSSGPPFDALAADPTGGAIAAGTTNDYVDFGGGRLGPPGFVLAKFGAMGQQVWSARFGVDPFTGLSGGQAQVAVDADDAVLLGGGFYGAIDLGTGVLPAVSSGTWPPTMFLAKYAQQAGYSSPAPRSACLPTLPAGFPSGARVVAGFTNLIADVALSPSTVYWTAGRGDVMSVPIAGGDPTPVAITQKGAGALAIDTQSLYWVNSGSIAGSGLGNDGSIVAMPLDGGAPKALATAQDRPLALAVDDPAVYWAAGGSPVSGGGSTEGTILTVPLTGGTPTKLVGNLGQPTAIAVHGGVVAFSVYTGNTSSGQPGSGSGVIGIVPRTGASSWTQLASAYTNSLAIDDRAVYWVRASSHGVDTTASDGAILSVPLTGGTPVVLASNLPVPGKLVLLGSTLYWANAGTFVDVTSGNNGGLSSMPIMGGTPTPIVANVSGVGPFAVDSTFVAFSSVFDGETAVSGLVLLPR